MAVKARSKASKAKHGKRYTVAQKRSFVSAWKAAKKQGVTFKAFCKKNKIAESTLRLWINNGFSGSNNSTKSTSARRTTTKGAKTRRSTRTSVKGRAKSKTTTTTKTKAKAKPKSRTAKGRAKSGSRSSVRRASTRRR